MKLILKDCLAVVLIAAIILIAIRLVFPPSKPIEFYVIATAYYTVKPNQLRCSSSSYKERIRMNGTGITKLGDIANPNIAAADPKYIPFNTILYFPQISRTVVIRDIGSKIKGPNRIDLHMGNDKYAECRAISFKPQKLKAQVLRWGN